MGQCASFASKTLLLFSTVDKMFELFEPTLSRPSSELKPGLGKPNPAINQTLLLGATVPDIPIPAVDNPPSGRPVAPLAHPASGVPQSTAYCGAAPRCCACHCKNCVYRCDVTKRASCVMKGQIAPDTGRQGETLFLLFTSH